MDALTEVLRRCRLESTVFSRAWLRAPWGVHSPQSAHGIFHAVTRGQAWLSVDGAAPALLRQGDVVFLPFGAPHTLSDAPGRLGHDIRALASRCDPGTLRVDGGGELTELLCGSLRFAQGDLHPLLGAAPPVMRAPAADPSVQGLLSLIARETAERPPGAETAIARLTDVLVIVGLRRWLDQAGTDARGWMAGLRDPHVSRALDLMHSHPAEDWTVALLARRVGLSRSAFAARFAELVGEPPSAYLTRWRMSLAAEALTTEPITLAEVAGRVGYRSEYALSKAFKRTTGLSPERYRASRRAASAV